MEEMDKKTKPDSFRQSFGRMLVNRNIENALWLEYWILPQCNSLFLASRTVLDVFVRVHKFFYSNQIRISKKTRSSGMGMGMAVRCVEIVYKSNKCNDIRCNSHSIGFVSF